MVPDTQDGVGAPAGIFDFARYGDRVAIRCEDGRVLDYAALATAADAAVAGIGPERTLVLIETANELAPLLAYLGAMRAGHAVLLVSAETPADRIAALVDTYRPGAIYARDDDAWTQRGHDAPVLHPDLLLLLSTSGSTGSAKLVRLSRAAVEANAASIATYLDIASDDRAVTTLPFHYSYGLSVVHSHLLRGATILLTDRSVVDPEFRRLAEEGAATSLAGVPYTYELLERSGFRDTASASLRTMTQAGGRLPAETARAYAEWTAARGARFFVMYGQTEATARMAYMPPDLLAAHPDHVGVAIPGGAFALLDADGGEIDAADMPGELVYRGANVMMGYAQDAADLARPAELDELRTGDIAQRNVAGLYRIVGRLSRFIKPFGVRVGLDEVESMLRRRDIVAAATGDDALLAVMLVARPGVDAQDERDRLAAAMNLPLSAVDVAVASDLPLLPSGKTDYPAILTAARERSAGAGGADGIARLFAESFPRTQPAAGDSFTSLGGDSLNYVMLSMGLERVIGHLPARWEHLSIAALEVLVPAGAAPRRRWWQVRWIESEVLIRALAILAIVVNHASDRWLVGGGADVLLLLFGYNLSRYQFGRLTTGRGAAIVRDFGLRIMAPYYAFLLAWSVAKRHADWPSLLLVSNYTGRFGSLMEPYWFLEMLFQTMLFVVVAFALPPLRRSVARHSWAAGVTMLIGGTALALACNALWPRPVLMYRTPELLFWLVGLGWCMHRASGIVQRGFLTLVILGILSVGYFHPLGAELGYPDGESARLWFAGSCLLILFVPRLPLNRAAASAVATVAAASFYIYLTHVVPVHVMLHVLHVRAELLVVPIAIIPGIAAWWLLQARRARGATAAD